MASATHELARPVELAVEAPAGLDQAARALLERLLAPGFHPPMLPTIAAEALQVAHRTDMSFQAVDAILRRDPLLAARVMSIANSPVYAGTSKVTSLRAAMLRLGCASLRDVLCQAVAEAHVFRGGSRRFLRQQVQHAVAVAHFTREVCRACRIDADYAFLCGLLHDLGRPLLLQQCETAGAEPPPPGAEPLHAAIGGAVARAWGLPDLVVDAAARHHDYGATAHAKRSHIGNAVALADRLAHHYGLGDPCEPIDLEHDSALTDLCMDSVEQAMLLERVAALAADLGG